MNIDSLQIKISLVENIPLDISTVFIINSLENLHSYSISPDEVAYIKHKASLGTFSISLNLVFPFRYVIYIEKPETKPNLIEHIRGLANKISDETKHQELDKICIVNTTGEAGMSQHVAESIFLSMYQFLVHKSDKSKQNKLNEIILVSHDITKAQAQWLHELVRSVYIVRNLVNQPYSHLNTEIFADAILSLCSLENVSIENFDKTKIESLRMGGLLSVNKGSNNPPVFSVVEYKPLSHLNVKPIVLVGKGVVYDTGGLGLKPTTNSMDYMKCDMAGAAVVVGLLRAIATLKLPIYVVGIMPITDNLIGPEAYAPGDVITISDGTTVEVMHTDAEGRLILADALHYAKKYSPELVIDFATLTGAAMRAIGKHGTVGFRTCTDEQFAALCKAGNNVYERIVEFPLWDEYKDEIKSDIADIKNLGGENAGATTAAKFLQHFTDYPWVHFDIAGPAYVFSHDSYRGKFATGVGVRMVMEFLKINYNLN